MALVTKPKKIKLIFTIIFVLMVAMTAFWAKSAYMRKKGNLKKE